MISIGKNFFLTILIILLALTACSKEKTSVSPELLIYCGITMAGPIQEIANIIEEQENCRITLLIDGSQNLFDIIDVNKVGDLYLPGSSKYMDAAVGKGYIQESSVVGYNLPSFIVQKGNPLNIQANLNVLSDPKIRVVLGSPESGSIGFKTMQILETADLYNMVMSNVVYVTADSRDISSAIIKGEADIGINWRATAMWPENSEYLDILPISDVPLYEEDILLGLLYFSPFPEIACTFIDYAVSNDGKEIFRKYGF